MNTGIIVQARMGSTRLPGKTMLPLPKDGKTLVIDHVLSRALAAKLPQTVIMATTTDAEDNPLERHVREHYPQVKIFRGSQNNVLERYYQAAKKHKLAIVIRITADCPCIDPLLIDQVLSFHQEKKSDYTSTSLVKTFPRGLDIEVINFSCLENVYLNATKEFEFEHVTPYIYHSNPKKFNTVAFQGEENFSHLRVTLDTEEDYELLNIIFSKLWDGKSLFGSNELIQFLLKNPSLNKINENVKQKKLEDDN